MADLPDLGGLNINPTAVEGDNTTANNASPSAEIVRQRKQRSDAGQPRGARKSNNGASLSAIPQEHFEKLYSPEVWSRVLSSPADAALAITGDKTWELGAEERQTLGVTGSTAARCFATTDPRYIALSLALIAIIDVYGIRLAKKYSDNKKKPVVTNA